jgi:hypothetical protein
MLAQVLGPELVRHLDKRPSSHGGLCAGDGTS